MLRTIFILLIRLFRILFFLLLCLINSFFGTFEKTQLQTERFLEHLAKWHCVMFCAMVSSGYDLLELEFTFPTDLLARNAFGTNVFCVYCFAILNNISGISEKSEHHITFNPSEFASCSKSIVAISLALFIGVVFFIII